MLDARPRTWCSTTWSLFAGSEELGEVSANWSKPHGTVQVGDQLFHVRRHKSKGPWRLKAGEAVVLEALRPKKSTALFEIPVGDDAVLVVPQGWDRRLFIVTNRDGTVLGRIERGSWFRRQVSIHLPEDMPVTVAAFLLHLILCYWSGQAAA